MGMFHLVGQGPLQLGELGVAFLLSALVGLERELKQKSAGLRTHTLVGVSAALFMLVSKYGFMDVLQTQRVVLDPSRVAAQVVSGIGFVGGGVIFMRRDVVRGLTTAASVWLTASLGMACGAGLPILAAAVAIIHFIIMLGFPRLTALLPHPRRTRHHITVTYADGRGLLRQILLACTGLRFSISHVALAREAGAAAVAAEVAQAVVADAARPDAPAAPNAVVLSLRVKGNRPVTRLIERLGEIDGVYHAGTEADETALD